MYVHVSRRTEVVPTDWPSPPADSGEPVGSWDHMPVGSWAQRFPLFFKPASLPGQSKDSHVKFILNHSDHVQVVRCISALKKRRESCLQLLDDGREGEIMPEGYLPFDYNLWRIMGHDID